MFLELGSILITNLHLSVWKKINKWKMKYFSGFWVEKCPSIKANTMIYDYSDFCACVSLPENQEWTFEAVTCHRFYLSGWKTAARGTEDLFFGWRQTNHNNNKHSFLCGRKNKMTLWSLSSRWHQSHTPTVTHSPAYFGSWTRLHQADAAGLVYPRNNTHKHRHSRCCCSRWLEINTRSGLWTIRGNM